MLYLAFVSGVILGIFSAILVTGLWRMRRMPSRAVIMLISALVVFFILAGFPDGSFCLALASTRVYLIAGQSNAAGMALSSELTDSEAAIPSNVELWVNVSGITGDHHLLSSHRDLPKFGPEVRIAKQLADHYPSERLIIIKVALGGTNMGHWDPSHPNNTMYDLFFFTIDAILQGEVPNFQNLFWMQGEQDMVTEYREDLYESRTIAFFADVRAAYGSDLVICMGLVNPPIAGFPYQHGVANGQIRIGKSDPYTRLVTTQGLSKFSDGVHYDKLGQIEQGRRMYCTAMGN